MAVAPGNYTLIVKAGKKRSLADSKKPPASLAASRGSCLSDLVVAPFHAEPGDCAGFGPFILHLVNGAHEVRTVVGAIVYSVFDRAVCVPFQLFVRSDYRQRDL